MPSMAFECYTIDQAAAAANISPRQGCSTLTDGSE